MYKLPDNVRTVINYLRRSRQDEERERRTGEDTLTEQKMLMDRVLSQYEGIVYEQRFEIGSGDKIETRPVFVQILKELEEGKFDAIAVKEISRLGRGSYTDMGRIYDLITNKRIYIITPYKVYDPSNSADLRQIRFELFLSREEFETTRERLMGARYTYAMNGKWMAGTVPYGYRFDRQTQRLIPHEEEAEVVRLIYDLFVNGLQGRSLGCYAIATYLTRLGYHTPNGKQHWHQMVVRRILSNPAYIGEVRFRVRKRQGNRLILRPENEWIVVKDAHEPIIPVELFEAAQRKMKTSHTPAVKMDFSPCELAGLVVCKQCGHKMLRQYQTQHYRKQDGTVSVYRKEFLRCPNGCIYVRYRDVEQEILDVLARLQVLDEEALEGYLRASIEMDEVQDTDKVIANLEQRKRELTKRLDFVFEKYEEGIYSDEEFVARKTKIQKEIADIERTLAWVTNSQAAPTRETNISIDTSRIRQDIRSVLDAYQRLTNKSRKNALLHKVIDHVEIEIIEKGRGRKRSKFDIDLRLNREMLGV
jgi:site-specific DNA recombinase